MCGWARVCVLEGGTCVCVQVQVFVREKRNLNLYEHRWVRVCVLVTARGLKDVRVTSKERERE